ncbi:MAG: hypothetical protein JXB26_00665 [Candidatus Aminicenantes bacterium]|nr:hypothetical protein [Candidatus Aminicenantes bacterium]
MKKGFFLRGTLMVCFAVLSAGLFLNLNAEKPIHLPVCEVTAKITIPDVSPRGLVFADKDMWILDAKGNRLLHYDRERKEVVTSLKLPVSGTGGVAWDGKNFWCADSRNNKIFRMDREKGEVVQSVSLPVPGKVSANTVGIAWDGKYLWAVYEAGWSSRLLKINADTGEVLDEMFVRSLPLGIAADSEHLWVLSRNTGKIPGVLSRRSFSEDADKMNSSRTFVCYIPAADPSGLAHDGQNLWVVDRKEGTVLKIKVPSEEVR